MVKYVLLLLLTSFYVAGLAQTGWIQQTTFPITADTSGKLGNFATWDTSLKNVSVVSLGEQTHLDGATFDAKVKLIKHLHEHLGFNVLAFESGYFDCSKVGQLLAEKGTGSILRKAVFGVWDNAALQDLEQYILGTYKTAHPLVVTGFDCQFSGELSKEYLVPALTAYLKVIGAQDLLQGARWTEFQTALGRQIKYSNYFKKPAPADTLLMNEMCFSMLQRIAANSSADRQQGVFWNLTIKNIISDYRHRYKSKNFRDSVMAENMLSLIKEQYSTEKIILWNATSHLIYHPGKISSKEYKDFIPMGSYLHEILGDRLYTVGFTSYEGRAGALLPHKLKEPSGW